MKQGIKDTIMRMNSMGAKGIPFFFMVDYTMTHAVVIPVDELGRHDVLVSTPWFRNGQERTEPGEYFFRKMPVPYERYEKAYHRVMEAINRGDTFLLNLTFPTELDTDLTLDRVFHAAHAKYRLRYKDRFVVFSPEPFITIEGDVISSFPMKGTVDAALEGAEQKLLTDVKEVSEHNTIVDLIRNDLSMVAKKVRVEKFRFVERVRTHERDLLQTSSKISGIVPEDWRTGLGDLLIRLLPAGSISGAPKEKTMEVIDEAEGYDRGWFTGIFGLFDGSNLESAVMIRYIEQGEQGLVFKSGGGITHFSDCRQEYDELVSKVYLPF